MDDKKDLPVTAAAASAVVVEPVSSSLSWTPLFYNDKEPTAVDTIHHKNNDDDDCDIRRTIAAIVEESTDDDVRGCCEVRLISLDHDNHCHSINNNNNSTERLLTDHSLDNGREEQTNAKSFDTSSSSVPADCCQHSNCHQHQHQHNNNILRHSLPRHSNTAAAATTQTAATGTRRRTRSTSDASFVFQQPQQQRHDHQTTLEQQQPSPSFASLLYASLSNFIGTASSSRNNHHNNNTLTLFLRIMLVSLALTVTFLDVTEDVIPDDSGDELRLMLKEIQQDTTAATKHDTLTDHTILRRSSPRAVDRAHAASSSSSNVEVVFLSQEQHQQINRPKHDFTLKAPTPTFGIRGRPAPSFAFAVKQNPEQRLTFRRRRRQDEEVTSEAGGGQQWLSLSSSSLATIFDKENVVSVGVVGSVAIVALFGILRHRRRAQQQQKRTTSQNALN